VRDVIITVAVISQLLPLARLEQVICVKRLRRFIIRD